MAFVPADFHFLRPQWLLALIPALMLYWWLRRRQANGSGWSRAIDRSLLPYLLDGKTGKQHGLALAFLLVGWLLATLALAGPAWEKLPQPVRKKTDALVIIQDLSLSMFATDLSPDRLTRARHKLLDLLAERREGATALIVYSGDAHVVAPLTDDTRTISGMVPDLSPAIMPVYGSNLPEAVSLALQLLKDGAAGRGRLLLITDEVESSDLGRVKDLLSGRDVVLSVLGVGTGDGGPIPKGDGGFLTDDRGEIVVPGLNRDILMNLAAMNSGRYSDIRLDDSDIDYLLAAQPLEIRDDQYRQIDREFDQWREQGYWLVLALLPLALLAFRRGWLLGLIMLLLLPAAEARAISWHDLWLRKDQQGMRALEKNEPQEAARLFEEPQWQGVASYRAGNYEEAAESFEESDSAKNHYNRGNALARQGRLQEAVEAYDKALQQDPELEDAGYNRELLKKMMEQQKQQGEQGKDRDSSKKQPGDKKDQDRQDAGKKDQPDQGRDGQGQNRQQSHDQTGEKQEGEDSLNKEQSGQQGSQQEQQEANRPEDKPQKGSSADKQADRKDNPEEQAKKAEEMAVGKAGEEEKTGTPESLTAEERQALELWLRRIPDNPGGLLKRKFEYQSQQNRDRNPSNNRKIW
ncbi:MAG: tetratricopeptide repeat protein [Desulfobulbaceae bacterium]|nr:tetratricopeptide repeat protein [Desulfobulbaceae bacterium]